MLVFQLASANSRAIGATDGGEA